MIPSWTWKHWILPWIMLGSSLFALAQGTGLLGLAALGTLALLVIPFLRHAWKLQKWIAYGAIVPFALWFLLAPAEGAPRIGALSVWALWIPGWYFWLLALLQLYSLDRGGERRFLWWNSAVALALGQSEASWDSLLASAPWMLAWIMDLRSAAVPERNPWRSGALVRWMLAFGVVALIWYFHAAIEAQFWNIASHSSGARYSRSMLRGFEPTGWLGSFASELESPYEREVALRVFSSHKPEYLRALAYASYGSGVWKSAVLEQTRYPLRNKVEYGIYAPDMDRPDPQTWIQPVLRDFGYLFLEPGTQVFAVQADSLSTDARGTWKGLSGSHRSGYFAGSPSQETFAPMDADLDVSPKLTGMLDSVVREWGIPSRAGHPQAILDTLQAQFTRNFEYALQVRMQASEDPLRTFFRNRRGYCEYFATASVLLLRRSGVPARYVAGFAYPKRVGDAWVFRRSDAHAWVEVWDGMAWIPFDPTPPSARPAIGEWSPWEQFREGFSAALGLWIHELRDGTWKMVLDRFGERLKGLLGSLILWALLLGGILAGILYIRRRKARGNTVQISAAKKLWRNKLDEAERRLRMQGHTREPGETVGQWLSRLPTTADAHSRKTLEEYQAHRFRPE